MGLARLRALKLNIVVFITSTLESRNGISPTQGIEALMNYDERIR